MFLILLDFQLSQTGFTSFVYRFNTFKWVPKYNTYQLNDFYIFKSTLKQTSVLRSPQFCLMSLIYYITI